MGRFDISFKSLGEQCPQAMLRLFGHAPLTAGTKVSPVDRELVTSIRSIDHAFLLENESGERWLEYFEAESSLSAEDLRQIPRRAMLLALKYDVQVWATIVLLARGKAPASLPEKVETDLGCVEVTTKLRYLKLWEMRPEVVLADCPVEALPLVGGMRATLEEFRETIDRLRRVENRELRERLLAELAVWSSVGYDKLKLEEIAARMGINLKDLMLISPIGEEIAREKLEQGMAAGWQKGVQEGRQEGRQEGNAEGQVQRARRDVLFVANSRFPELLDAKRIEACEDSEKLDAIFGALVTAADRDVAASNLRALLGD